MSSVSLPRIIHQTWKNLQIPEQWRPLQHSWRQHHPQWEHRFYGDLDLREVIRKDYAWFLLIYDGYPLPIMRVDAARYFLMHRYGGLYVDMDLESLRPIDELLDGPEVLLGLEPAEHAELPLARDRGLTAILCNALLASRPGHPFWEHIFQQLVACHRMPSPLDATGPFFLTRALSSWPQRASVTVVSSDLLYPISQQQSEQGLLDDPGQRARLAAGSFAVHHWSESRWRPGVRPAKTPAAVAIPLRLFSQGKLLFTATLHPDRYNALPRRRDPLVSCLMVTKGRPVLAERAIDCFLAQSYPQKEIVIIDDDADDSLARRVERINDPRIVYVRLPAEDKPLGALRNLAVQRATGALVCQWDDDDLYHPRRLELQIAALRSTGADACTLMRHQLFWPTQRRLCLSVNRIWEGSLLCRKQKLPLYPLLRRGEDTPVVEKLVGRSRIALLDAPSLYTYVFHGTNTFGAEHFAEHFAQATESFEGVLYESEVRKLAAALPSEVGAALLREGLPDAYERPRPSPPAADSAARPAFSNKAAAPPDVLVLTPVKDAVLFLDRYFENLRRLRHPHKRLSVAFLDSDSVDGTYEQLRARLPELSREFARAELFKRDYGYHLRGPRWEDSIQLQRRSLLARSRNYLLSRGLSHPPDPAAPDWVLWLDVDVTDYPADVIETLLASGKEIVVPNCVASPGGKTFDMNTFRYRPLLAGEDASQLTYSDRRYLSDLRQESLVELDAVGGTMLLIKADLHREGLNFPTFNYKGYIETEGLAVLAKDMGYSCWGLPNLEIVHPLR